ncbi:DUF1294 domain-containing protein [Ruminococcus gauvreauii]|uniref:DUF1294 domain-containing protein n=1 Tax=Ruminococcus gauvreauii TaxID=438033 RepID=A0ABY5VGZ4_9FIRM|nr:DUF1294 domain-containing protein [Ruminococcus gauvreauii]UWP58773.1 DUF1294 domain-containing protein [Ruminococcus gauvreauii]
MLQYMAGYLLMINLITLFAYGMDKRRARLGKWRVKERTLLLLAVIGGSAGALLGIYGFRHKTKHKKFTLLIPVLLACHTVLLIRFFMEYSG